MESTEMSPIAIVEIIKMTTHSRDIEAPQVYSKATSEILALTILVNGVITGICKPGVFDDNGLKRMLGYNNPCVVWDAPPALHVAIVMMTPVIFCVGRMIQLETKRIYLHQDVTLTHKRIARFAHLVYAASTCMVFQIFVITPACDDLWATKMHTMFFIMLIPCMAFRVLVDMSVEFALGTTFTMYQKIFLVIYALITILDFSLLLYSVIKFEQFGDDPVVPPMLLQTIDYAWFLCLPILGRCLPQGTPMVANYELVEKLP